MKIRILVVVLAWVCFSGTAWGQEEVIKEGVTVTNIEIPVRVFLKGKIVDNLKKSDFTLFINGEKREIAGFTVTRKRLEQQQFELQEKKPEFPPRYFILALNITHFSPEIKEGVNHVIHHVLRDQDILLLFINNTTKRYNDLKNRDAVKDEIFKYIQEESIKAQTRMQLYFKEVERASYVTKFRLMMKRPGSRTMGEPDQYKISDFLKNYLHIWKEYKKRYLTPNVNTYYNLSKYLQNIKIEKWVISFFQVERFPEIALDGEIIRIIQAYIYKWQESEVSEENSFARIVSRQLAEVQKAMNVSDGFPTEQVTKIFTKVGATFHSVFIPSTIPTFSKDMKYKQISSDLENNLRNLTEKTGGELIASKDLAKAMDKIVKKEDVFYVLTYAPDEGEKLETVKIKASSKKYDLAYDDNTRLPFSDAAAAPGKNIKLPEVMISDLKFEGKKLSFTMSGYGRKKKDNSGAVNVRIRINDASGKSLFDKNKTLKTAKEKAGLSLNFPWLIKGQYEILVDVKDLYTKKTATDVIKIKIR